MLLCLLLLGSSYVLTPFFQRINTLKLGIAEVSLNARNPKNLVKSTDTVSAGQKSKDFASMTLAELERSITRDYVHYIAILLDSEIQGKKHVRPKDPKTLGFIQNNVTPLATCYNVLIDTTDNSNLRDQALDAMYEPLATIVSLSRQEATSKQLMNHLQEPIKLFTDKLAIAIEDAKIKLVRGQINIPECDHVKKESRSHDELAMQLNNGLNASLVEDEDFVNRPYFAIAFAAMGAAIGQETAVFNELDKWAQNINCTGFDARKEKTDDEISEDVKQCWLNIRTRLTLHFLMEQWLRADANIPQSYHTYHFKNVEKLLDQLSGFHGVNQSLDSFGILADPVSSNYSRRPNDFANNPCLLRGFYDDDNFKFELGYTLLTFQIVYIDRALEQPRSNYTEGYMRRVKSYTDLFDKISLECVYNNRDVNEFHLRRADMLRATAKAELAHLEAVQNLKQPAQAEVELQRIKTIIELAKEILGQQAGSGLPPEKWADTTPTEGEEIAQELVALDKEITLKLETQ